MAGLAASIGAGTAARAAAIADALAARGPATATWRCEGIDLAVRAAMPAVHRIPARPAQPGSAAGSYIERALLIDGNAAPSAIDARYGEHGATALFAGPDPYALVLADPAREALVLARHGDGPPLYWASHGAAVMVASEPAALLAAGLPAQPDPVVVERYLATGACDEGAETFFAGITRVLPGEAVEIIRDPGAGTFTIRVHPPEAEAGRTGLPVTPAALPEGRCGLRLGGTRASLALLEATLRTPGVPRPLPVYSASFPELAGVGGTAYAAGQAAVPKLASLARASEVRHRALPFFGDEIDVDAYLADLGEPTPDLSDWLLWAVARRVAGEVDTLLDSAAGTGHLSRLADRIATRFGIQVRFGTGGPGEPGEPGSTGEPRPDERPGPQPLLTELLCRMRGELVTTFLAPHHPAERSGLADVMALLSRGRGDPAALWRRYLLERWLRCVVAPAGGVAAVPTRPGPSPVIVDSTTWVRQPVRTEVFAAGDKIPEKVAWYVNEVAGTPTSTWYVLVAAKPVSVMQGRARSLWNIRPGLTARSLHWLAGRSEAGPWLGQVAIEESSRWRQTVATLCATAGRIGWYERIAGPAVCAIRGPRADAVPPGHVCVTPAPADPDGVAAEIVSALRSALPEAAYATLGGCAIVAGRVLGWAAHPGADPEPPELLPALVADDPFPGDQTPIVVVLPAAVPAAVPPG